MHPKTSSEKIPLAIVGFGNMGKRHWQALAQSENFKVTALADPHAHNLPKKAGVRHFHDYRDLVSGEGSGEGSGEVEAVLVAAPSVLHAEMGLYFLDAGLPLFMEKPLALSLPDCRLLAERAAATGAKAMVGMVERFNPGFVACRDLLRRFSIRPRRFVIERFNPSSAISDSDVVLDLAVHDLDILLSLVGDIAVDRVTVRDVRVGDYGYDYVSFVLLFVGGIEAEIRVGRGALCGEARRYWSCEWEGGCCGIDFLARELGYFEHLGKSYVGNLGGDALLSEHNLFADIIRGGENILDFGENLRMMELLFFLKCSHLHA